MCSCCWLSLVRVLGIEATWRLGVYQPDTCGLLIQAEVRETLAASGTDINELLEKFSTNTKAN